MFIPTGAPSPDFFGGERRGDNRYANSIVALRASTGELVWQQQLVHHDLWDYDVVRAAGAGRPRAGRPQRAGGDRQATKMGLLFTFDRVTGEPVFRDRGAPGAAGRGRGRGAVADPAVPGGAAAAGLACAGAPRGCLGADPLGQVALPQADRALSLGGHLHAAQPRRHDHQRRAMPAASTGAAWPSSPSARLAIVNAMQVPMVVTLIPREAWRRRAIRAFADSEFAEQRGTPYGMRREVLLSPLGIPCTAPPWGMLSAVDMAAGTIAGRCRSARPRATRRSGSSSACPTWAGRSSRRAA